MHRRPVGRGSRNPRLSDSRRGGPTPEMAMPAVTIKADGRTPAKARRRPPRRWSRVRPAAPLDPDRRQRLEPLPAVRLRAPRLPLRPGAVAPSAPARVRSGRTLASGAAGFTSIRIDRNHPERRALPSPFDPGAARRVHVLLRRGAADAVPYTASVLSTVHPLPPRALRLAFGAATANRSSIFRLCS